MRRAILVAFMVVALLFGIVAIAGAATVRGENTVGVSLEPAVWYAAAWVAEQSTDTGTLSASSHDPMECDHGIRSAQDASVSY